MTREPRTPSRMPTLIRRQYLSSSMPRDSKPRRPQVAKYENKRYSSLGKKGMVAVVVISACFITLLVIAFGYWLVKYKKHAQSRRSTQLLDGENNSNLPLFDLSDIVAATDNFSDANKFGQGGFGSVYKGLLKNGMAIAVKRLSKYSGQGIEEFRNEVALIAKLQHRNLVRILGCCIHGEEKMLIYEYLPNKSLDSFIFVATCHLNMQWKDYSQSNLIYIALEFYFWRLLLAK